VIICFGRWVPYSYEAIEKQQEVDEKSNNWGRGPYLLTTKGQDGILSVIHKDEEEKDVIEYKETSIPILPPNSHKQEKTLLNENQKKNSINQQSQLLDSLESISIQTTYLAWLFSSPLSFLFFFSLPFLVVFVYYLISYFVCKPLGFLDSLLQEERLVQYEKER